MTRPKPLLEGFLDWTTDSKIGKVVGYLLLMIGCAVVGGFCFGILHEEWHETGAGQTPYHGWGVMAFVPGLILLCCVGVWVFPVYSAIYYSISWFVGLFRRTSRRAS